MTLNLKDVNRYPHNLVGVALLRSAKNKNYIIMTIMSSGLSNFMTLCPKMMSKVFHFMKGYDIVCGYRNSLSETSAMNGSQ